MLSRKELSDMILKAPQTEDGYYFFPRFKSLVMQDGPIDDGQYFFDRDVFKKKTCFSITDVKAFLSQNEIEYDTTLSSIMDSKLEEAIGDFGYLDLKDIVPKTEYTLEELIDTCVFIVKEKYA